MNFEDGYLPIGTVVTLIGGTKKVMITGFCAIQESNKDKMWDYSACLYPEGFLSSNQTCLFDHSQIQEIHFLGLENDEEKEFKKKLMELKNEINKNAKSE